MTDITLQSIILPSDLYWSDEFTGWQVGQSQRISVTGIPVINESSRQSGRPITLETTQTRGAYVGVITLPVLRALQALETQVRSTPMTLVMPAHNAGTRTFEVLFNRSGGKALEAKPLLFAAPYYDDDRFSLTLRLIQV